MELSDVAEELYGLPPDEFTKSRNERAKETKADDKALSDAIKRLPKPSTSAWAVNMLARHQADLLSQVLDLGESLRQAAADLDGAELRELNKQRRQLTAAVTGQTRQLAHELGVRLSDTVADQVEETLRAAMIDEGATRAVRTGQLLEPLSATGVGDLDVSAAVAVPEAIGMRARPVERPRAKLSVVEEPESEAEPGEADQRALEEARRAAEEAAGAAETARKKLDKANKRVAKLEARSLQIQGELEEVRRKASDLEYQLENVEDDLSSAEEKRDLAEEARVEAETAEDEARTVLADLES